MRRLLYDMSMGEPKKIHGYDLTEVVSHVRAYAGVEGKRPIASVSRFIDTSDPVHGPGDDGAIVDVGDHNVVVCGEALSPPFVNADPYGAGLAAVLANVNDIAAMGGTPLAIVNTLVGPPETTSKAMQGMADAAAMYDVPIVGGHLTERPGDTSLSAFAVGDAPGVLSMANVREGQVVLFAGFLDGRMRDDFPFFTSIDNQANRFASDIRTLAEVSAEGLAVAAKDVSMAGPLGSLAMLLEFTKLGATIDLEVLPTPPDVDFLKWLICFPSFCFWLTAEPETVDACISLFEAKGLTCTAVGTVSHNSSLTLTAHARSAELLDLANESVTGLWT